MKSGMYEVIGGPYDGAQFSQCSCGCGRFALPDFDDPFIRHHYRLCSCQDRRGRVAKYWHYVGTNPDACPEPVLWPPKRLYRRQK